MLSQILPHGAISALNVSDPAGGVRSMRAFANPELSTATWRSEGAGRPKERHGPLRVQLHAAARCQGSGLDPGFLSSGFGSRWVRRALLLPNTRSPGTRCWRECVARRDRTIDSPLRTVFGRAGGF